MRSNKISVIKSEFSQITKLFRNFRINLRRSLMLFANKSFIFAILRTNISRHRAKFKIWDSSRLIQFQVYSLKKKTRVSENSVKKRGGNSAGRGLPLGRSQSHGRNKRLSPESHFMIKIRATSQFYTYLFLSIFKIS